MKTLFKKLIAISLLVIVSVSCSKDSDSSSSNGTNYGTFVGNLQVVDDPQTKLGYVFNTNVTVTTSGSNGTIKVTGDDGFDREYIGTVNAGSTANIALIVINKQTKPVDKNAAGSVTVSGSELAIQLNLASDDIVVRQTATTPTFNIAGKIGIIGAPFIKK
jgi:hypothetical protein